MLIYGHWQDCLHHSLSSWFLSILLLVHFYQVHQLNCSSIFLISSFLCVIEKSKSNKLMSVVRKSNHPYVQIFQRKSFFYIFIWHTSSFQRCDRRVNSPSLLPYGYGIPFWQVDQYWSSLNAKVMKMATVYDDLHVSIHVHVLLICAELDTDHVKLLPYVNCRNLSGTSEDTSICRIQTTLSSYQAVFNYETPPYCKMAWYHLNGNTVVLYNTFIP